MLRALILALPLALVGCASPTPTNQHPPTSASAPGAEALLLRYACERGPIEEPLDRTCWGPTFSLYGDGRTIYRDATQRVEVDDAGRRTYDGYRTVGLPPAEVAGLLDRARSQLGPLVDATPTPPPTEPVPISDPFWWDRFAIDIDGRLVEVAPGQGPIPPSGVPYNVAGILSLVTAWRPPTPELVAASAPYEPDRYCAWIYGGVAAIDPWPWDDLRPEDFGAEPGKAVRTHELTPAQARAVLPGTAAGRASITVRIPDGEDGVGLAVRALMPDESCDQAAF